MIRFSIITIVRNDAVGVIRTLQSVFTQTYQNYELIVQDGASTDETSDVLRSLGRWIDSLTIEQDGGIYDAMNRALRRANGDYLLFLNAADFFIDDQVLDKVASMIVPEKDDIFVGQALSDETGKIHTYRAPHHYWLGSTCDHQATFIRTDLMKKLEYDQQYKIAGDLHFFTRARQEGARFRYEKIKIVRKPFSVGASSDFLDRINDRLDMLETAWGKEHPVRERIGEEFVNNLKQEFDVPDEAVEGKTIAELMELREQWLRQLLDGKPKLHQAAWKS